MIEIGLHHAVAPLIIEALERRGIAGPCSLFKQAWKGPNHDLDEELYNISFPQSGIPFTATVVYDRTRMKLRLDFYSQLGKPLSLAFFYVTKGLAPVDDDYCGTGGLARTVIQGKPSDDMLAFMVESVEAIAAMVRLWRESHESVEAFAHEKVRDHAIVEALQERR